MANIATSRIGMVLRLDNGKEFVINEEDKIAGLVYKSGVEQVTLDGRVRVICGSTKGASVLPQDCPPSSYMRQYVTVSQLIIDYSEKDVAKLIRIPVANIVDIESVTVAGEEVDENTIVVGSGPAYKDLATVLAEAAPGSTIKLTAGEYAAPLTIAKDLTIVGTGADTVLTGKIAAAGPSGEPINVAIDGVKLTGDALVAVGANVEAFSMTNSVFEGHNMTQKTMPIALSGTEPILLTIEGNTFGDQNGFSYNLIDVYGALKDGSSISNNDFTATSCAHNQISLYGIEDGATIHIDNNHAAESKNMVRIGFKGTPKGTVVMNGNSYDETDSDPAYAGLVLVQPYGKQTDSFSGVTIEINDTTKPAGTQLGYIYAGNNDTAWTDDNKPTFVVDGTNILVPTPTNDAHVGQLVLEKVDT